MRGRALRWGVGGVAGLTVLYAPTWAMGVQDFILSPHWQTAIGQPGANDHVIALLEYDGDLIAGGAFTSIGDVSANRIARWDGKTWSLLGGEDGGAFNGTVRGLAVVEGELYAGGEFIEVGGQPTERFARWDGAAWHPVTDAQDGTWWIVLDLTVHDGALIASGWFEPGPECEHGVTCIHVPGGGVLTVDAVARWNGAHWEPYGLWTGSWIWDIEVVNGELIAAGDFEDTSDGGSPVNGIARWNGDSWQGLAGGVGGYTWTVWSVAEYNGGLVAGGHFTSTGGAEVGHVAMWDGIAWTPLGGGMGDDDQMYVNVRALASYGGSLVAGGEFTTAGSDPTDNIAMWVNTEDAAAPESADLNGDGAVDVLDLVVLLAEWGVCSAGGACVADLGWQRLG